MLEPNPERGSIHEAKVIVNSRHLNEGEDLISERQPYRIDMFSIELLFQTRLFILSVLLIVMTVGVILPYWLWVKFLKRQYLSD